MPIVFSYSKYTNKFEIVKPIDENKLLKGLSQKDLSNALRISEDSISLWIKKGKLPTATNLIKIANILEVSTDFLLGREEISFSNPEKIEIKKDIRRLEEKFDKLGASEVAPVPLLEDSIAAGAPVPISGISRESRYFLKSWLRQFRNPILVKVGKHQESMSPTILPGDLLLIDRRPVCRPARNAIYALNAEEGGTIKRCSFSDGKLRLIPDNPNYSDKYIIVQDADIQKIIVGRVVWIARELYDLEEKKKNNCD